MACLCNYTNLKKVSCRTCINVAGDTAEITQKRIWNQVRVPASLYLMNLAAFTSAGKRIATGTNVNWNQMSDRVNASVQPVTSVTRGNSLHNTITSNRPGAGTPGGAGVDVKHDSYARYLNRKKASNMNTQNIVTTPLYGNKIKMVGFDFNCCP
jgi:hypothetical protein